MRRGCIILIFVKSRFGIAEQENNIPTGLKKKLSFSGKVPQMSLNPVDGWNN